MPKLTARVTANISDFTKAMAKTQLSAKNAAKGVGLAFAGIAAGVAGIGIQALKTAKKFEDLKKRLQGVLGKEEGAKIFKKIQDEAQKSVLETDELGEAYIRMTALMGGKIDFKLAEAIGFAAKQLDQPISLVTERMARLFNVLKAGDKIDKDLRLSLAGVFPPAFLKKMQTAEQGTIKLEEAMSELYKKSEELKEIFSTGISASLAQLQGAWTGFLLSLMGFDSDADTPMGKLADMIDKATESINKMAKSKAVKEITEQIKEMVDEFSKIDSDEFAQDMVDALQAITGIGQFLIKVGGIFVKIFQTAKEFSEWLTETKGGQLLLGFNPDNDPEKYGAAPTQSQYQRQIKQIMTNPYAGRENQEKVFTKELPPWMKPGEVYKPIPVKVVSEDGTNAFQ